MSKNNSAIMQSEDKRLNATTEALQNMKTIKEISKQTISKYRYTIPIFTKQS